MCPVLLFLPEKKKQKSLLHYTNCSLPVNQPRHITLVWDDHFIIAITNIRIKPVNKWQLKKTKPGWIVATMAPNFSYKLEF